MFSAAPITFFQVSPLYSREEHHSTSLHQTTFLNEYICAGVSQMPGSIGDKKTNLKEKPEISSLWEKMTILNFTSAFKHEGTVSSFSFIRLYTTTLRGNKF